MDFFLLLNRREECGLRKRISLCVFLMKSKDWIRTRTFVLDRMIAAAGRRSRVVLPCGWVLSGNF